MKGVQFNMDGIYEDSKYGGSYPMYDLKIYTSSNDSIVVFLDTDDFGGAQTRKAANFIEVLMENGIAFDLTCQGGGKWWESTFDKYADKK